MWLGYKLPFRRNRQQAAMLTPLPLREWLFIGDVKKAGFIADRFADGARG
jgi:hypothetical protein